jgi:hypothetical protein
MAALASDILGNNNLTYDMMKAGRGPVERQRRTFRRGGGSLVIGVIGASTKALTLSLARAGIFRPNSSSAGVGFTTDRSRPSALAARPRPREAPVALELGADIGDARAMFAEIAVMKEGIRKELHPIHASVERRLLVPVDTHDVFASQNQTNLPVASGLPVGRSSWRQLPPKL